MASLAACRRAVLAPNAYTRSLTTAPPSATSAPSPPTHFKITLRRSAISLGDRFKATLEALGIHKRNQTVYQKHSSDIAGKILRVKELVEVENVPASAVRNKWEQRQERKAVRGYKVVGSRRNTFMNL
ncbi:hypothetical protein AGABI2DRAFT_192113 [Agaricus bisporus var. bisporus H97]|uniref:hypothetical protein n=1 Tax=Agaricus bisporus var. bisporus (strain H97 / ATCC MYA-4626 / FGSC 10389) TaxID=936046 RepID=UPI00029F5D92|nr:hypothetical protein AGABI2DRAFT_192113 [Agaricus bisporus var. bisporus H97]EKV48523.1 hypothetical protein AGABI2DRAFT_192113 [Agaricus bisporus var. bisporus H97]